MNHSDRKTIKSNGVLNYYRYLILLIFVANLIFTLSVSAEGTKEFKGKGKSKNKCSIYFAQSAYTNFAKYGADTNHRLYIHINKPGEIIYYGFAIISTTLNYRIKDPNGNIVVAASVVPKSGQQGYINNYNEAAIGPGVLNTGGYNALSYTSLMKGDYFIEFSAACSTELFDFTVYDPTVKKTKLGRLWSRCWDFSLPSYNDPFEGTAFIYADDGIVTSITFQKLKPAVFTLIANRTGCTNTNNFILDRQSQLGKVNYPQYRIFFNNPDTIGYPSGTYGKLTPPVTLTGCDGDFCLNFNVNKPGPIQVMLDLNGKSGYQSNSEDIILTDTLKVAGANCIHWNGKNGLGNNVPSGMRISIDLNYFNGLTNLPLYDVESDSTGYIVKLIRPYTVDSVPYVFWDDTNITPHQFNYVPRGGRNLTGCRDLVNGCHTWVYDFGNEATINTWWYANIIKADLMTFHNYASAQTNSNLLAGQKADTTVCLAPGENKLNLNGLVTQSRGGIWTTTGTGTYSPYDTAAYRINTVYNFSDADIAKGNVMLILTTRGTYTGCHNATDTMRVKIVKTTAYSAGADQTICKGSQAKLMATGGTSYTWTPGGLTNQIIIVAPTQTTTYMAQINISNCKAFDQVVVFVTSPKISAGYDQSICKGATTTLTASGGISYKWSNGGITVSTTVNPSVTSTYYVTGTDNTSLACTAVDTVVVNVGNFAADAGKDQSICFSDSATLLAKGSSTFLWSTGSTLQSIKVNPTTNTTYKVTSTSGACTATDFVVITVNPQMRVAANAVPSTICIPAGSTLTANGATDYVWSSGGIGASATVSPTISTTYKVTGTTSGCTATTSVIVNVDTKISVTATSSPGTICPGISAIIRGSGGNSYSWNNGSINDTLVVKPTTTTTYKVTGTSGNCSGTANVTVTYVTSLPVNVSANPSSLCNGSNSTLTATGGTTYSWSTSSTTNPISVNPTTTTTYKVTGTSSGCTGTGNIVVTVNPIPTITVSASPSTICNGSSTAITASGGTTYSWNTGATTSSINVNPTTTTTYKVTGTSLGCTGTASIVITVNPLPIITVSSGQSTICNGGSTNLTASGGTTYSWSTSAATNPITVNPTTTTTYKVTGTVSGCTNTASIVVTVTPLPTISASANPSAICTGGSSTLTASGGITYSWSTSATTNPITVTPTTATTYRVTGTGSGCTNTASVVVTINPSITVSATASPSTICNGNSTTLTATGGTTYSWSTTATTNPLTVNPTTTTTYKVTGTSSGCTGTATVVVTVNPSITVSATANPSTICNGATTSLTASGGTTYSWSTSATTNPLTVSPTNTSTYKVTGTTNGCTNTASIVVTVNPSIIVSATANPSTICSGSNATLTATGGTTYLWSTSATTNPLTVTPTTTTTYKVTGTSSGCTGTATVVVTVNPSITVSATANPSTICSGSSATLTATGGTTYLWSTSATTNPLTVNPTITTTYKVTGTSNGCTNTASVVVTVNPIPNISASASPSTICSGGNSTLTASGATTYSWNTGGTTASISVNPIATTTYKVTGTSNGCTNTANIVVTVNPSITVSATANPSTICSGGSATLTATGGTTYLWSTSATSNPSTVTPVISTTYNVTGTSNGCTNTASVIVTVNPSITVNVTANPSTICTGTNAVLTATGGSTYLWSTSATTNPLTVTPTITSTYKVTGTSNGCTSTGTVTVIVNPLPVVSASSNQTICNGQSATITASGATTYSWRNLTASIDLSALNPISVTPTITSTYSVTGTTNGCTSTAQSVITVNPLPVVSAGANQTICPGLSATLTATGATTYSWRNLTASIDLSALNPISVTPTVTSTYSVTGTTNGCTGTSQTIVSVNALTTISAGADQNICNGQTATLTASGGTSYIWNTGQSTNPITLSPTVTTTYKVTGTISGCTGTSQITVNVNSVPTVSAGVNQTICTGGSTTLTASGGTTYSWSNTYTINPVTVNPTNTTTYKVTGTSSGCTNTANIVVTVSPNPVITVNSPSICSGDTATLTASGGTTYNWNTGNTGSTIKVFPRLNTTYSVTGTTGTCSGTSQAVVSINSNPVISVNSPALCSGSTATLTATGATNYIWSTGASGVTLQVSPRLNTTYKVTGSTGTCSGTALATVTVNSNPVITVNNTTVCAGNITTLTATGGTTYSWASGAKTAAINVTPLSTATFVVTGTTNNCTGTALATVTVNPNPALTVNSPVICSGNIVTLTAGGGTTYVWSTGLTTTSITVQPTVTSTYTVTATTGSCTSTAISTVTVNATPVVSVNSPTICSGNTATITASGASSYSWSTGELTATIQVSPRLNSNYKVTGTTGSCTSTAVSTVTVNSNPVISVNNPTLCKGNSVSLTASGGASYSWSTGEATNTITVNPTVTTTYQITATTLSCTGTLTAIVTVNTAPLITVSTICSVGSATLMASGGTTYTWSTGATINTITVSPKLTGIYTVTGTVGGCTAKVLTSVNILPVIANAGPDKTINPGGTGLTLTATGGSVYSWDNGLTTASITVNPAITTTFTVTVKNSYGCMATDNVIVTVNSNTAPPVINQVLNICYWGDTTLTASGGILFRWSTGSRLKSIIVNPTTSTTYFCTATSTNGTSSVSQYTVAVEQIRALVTPLSTACQYSPVVLNVVDSLNPFVLLDKYIWTTGDTVPSITVNPATTSQYSVTIVKNTPKVCYSSATLNVKVKKLPPAYGRMDATLCKGQSTTFTVLQCLNGTYRWVTGATTPSITVSPTITTNYTVTITSAEGCSVTDLYVANVNCKENNESAINSQFIIHNSQLLIFPNPATNRLNIDNATGSEIKIFDMIGTEVLSVKQATSHLQFNLSTFPSGIYLIRFTLNGNTFTRKLVHQND